MNEVEARTLLAILKGERIRAELRQFHNPWEISWFEGKPWGEILVLKQDAERARTAIEEYLSGLEEKQESRNDAEDSK